MSVQGNGFTTQLPESWEDRTMTTLVAPFKPGSFAVNVVITKHFIASNESVEGFAEEQTQMLKQSLPRYEVFDRRSTVINGLPAVQQLHRFQTENGLLQQAQTFVLAEAAVFAITCTATVQEFAAYIPAFRQIVENFQVAENL
jgi:hypothetical protein